MSAQEEPTPATLRFERIATCHLREVTAIEVEAYPEPWTENMFRQEIYNGSSHFYIGMLDETVVAYVGFWLVLDEAHITSVTVRDIYRGRGFGRQLMEFILDAAARVEAKHATLEVRVSNHRAQNLYRSMGFREIYVRKGYYAKNKEDALVMMREIGASGSEDVPHDGGTLLA